jgi:hypothetical protein
MEKQFLNFVEPLPGSSDENLNLFGINLGSAFTLLAGGSPTKVVEESLANTLKKQADVIPNDPNPNAFAADLKGPAETLARMAASVPASASAIKQQIQAKADRYKAAYDKAVADEAKAATASSTPGAGSIEHPGTPGAGSSASASGASVAGAPGAAKSAGMSKTMKYVVIGSGVVLVGVLVYVLVKKK